MKKNKRAYKLSPAAIAQRRAASKIAGEKRRKGPRKSVSLRADAADILRDAAKNRGLSKSEVIRRDVKPEAASPAAQKFSSINLPLSIPHAPQNPA